MSRKIPWIFDGKDYYREFKIGKCLVSSIDYEKIRDLPVTVSVRNNRGYQIIVYVIIEKDNHKKRIPLHRFLLNPPKDLVVDHINHNRLDNRRENLRICNQSENSCNRKKHMNNTSGFKNIKKYSIYSKFGRYDYYNVNICKNYKCHHKSFNYIKDAIEWRNKKLKELHGEFAYIPKDEDVTNEINLYPKGTAKAQFKYYIKINNKIVRTNEFEEIIKTCKKELQII